MRSISPGSARSCRPWRNWIGPSAAIYAPISLGDPDPENISKQAAELVALAPDVIVAAGTSTVGPVLQATRTIPVVFPIGRRSGRRRLRRQFGAAGRQCHGIPSVRIQPGRKRLELLKRIAPGVTRVAVIRDPTTPSGFGQFAAIQAVSPSLGMEIEPVNMRDKQEIEGAIATFADAPNGGMILSGSSRAMIIELAARHKLPTVYYERF